MATTRKSNTHYFMRDQVQGKVSGLMDEGWISGPLGAICTLLALVTAFSVVGGMCTVRAAESIAVIGGWLG